MTIAKQLWGKLALWVLLLSACVHVLAFFTRETVAEPIALGAIALGVGFLAWRRLEWGMFVVFAELFVGGHGHLLSVEIFGFSVSLRMTIFVALMSVWVLKYAKNMRPRVILWRDLPWLLLLIAVAWGTLMGLLRNDLGAMLDDANGFGMFAYLLPLLCISWTHTNKHALLQVLTGSFVWVGTFTLLLGYAFSHLDGKTLHVLYTFVRDARLAEVTLQVFDSAHVLSSLEYAYRVFQPAQWSVVVMGLLMFSACVFLWRKERIHELAVVFFGFSISVLIFSLSRSFVLGFLCGSVILSILAWGFGSARYRIILRSLGAILIGAIAFLGVYLLVWVPLPERPDLREAAFYATSSQTGRSEAVASRWNLLGPMNEAIFTRPILGSGFGTQLSYVSEDPRIRAQEDGGVYTTYRFEWGWHDLWFKMGILGPIAFVFYIVGLARVTRVTIRRHGYVWLSAGLFASVLALFITHIFSPFLNHPIGIGFLLFVIPFFDWDALDKVPIPLRFPVKTKTASTAVMVTARNIQKT